jgi:hypothetical protein
MDYQRYGAQTVLSDLHSHVYDGISFVRHGT